jgi:phosphoglucosamine mutase
MITAINLVRVMREKDEPLGRLVQGFSRFPQVLVNIHVREKVRFEALPKVQEKAHQIEQEMGDRGRLLLRYSGTEPLARVMIEGEDEQQVRNSAESLAAVIKAEIGSDG